MKKIIIFRPGYFRIIGLLIITTLCNFAVSPVFAQAGSGSELPVSKAKTVIGTNPLHSGKEGFQGQISFFAGYDSNLTYGSGGDTGTTRYEQVVPALSFKLNSSVKWVTSELHQRFAAKSPFQYGAEVGMNYHQPYEMTTSQGIYNDPRFSGFLKGVLFWVPSRYFKIQLYEIMNRFSKTHYLLKNDFTLNWINNKVGVFTSIVPGDGLIETTIGYEMDLLLFEQSELSSANRIAHKFSFRASYRFLPNSLLWLAATYDMNQYLENSSQNSMPIKGYAGISTPLWTNLTLTLGGGYSYPLSGTMPMTWLATTTLTYTMASKLKIGFNYNHNFEDTIIGSYADQNDFSLFGFIPIGQKMLFQAQVGYKIINYMGLTYTNPPATAPTSRLDNIVFTSLQLSYKFSKSLVGSISYQFMLDSSDYRLLGITGNSDEPVIDNDPSFMKHEIYFAIQYFF
jgi:hypothetical protein